MTHGSKFTTVGPSASAMPSVYSAVNTVPPKCPVNFPHPHRVSSCTSACRFEVPAGNQTCPSAPSKAHVRPADASCFKADAGQSKPECARNGSPHRAHRQSLLLGCDSPWLTHSTARDHRRVPIKLSGEEVKILRRACALMRNWPPSGAQELLHTTALPCRTAHCPPGGTVCAAW